LNSKKTALRTNHEHRQVLAVIHGTTKWTELPVKDWPRAKGNF
jgi:hypothetical protein